MDMQGRDRDMVNEYNRRQDELERDRLEAIERDAVVAEDADMTGVPVEAAEPGTDPRVGAAVVGGALGAVAGAIVGGPAGAIVGGAVGAAGGAVVAQGGERDDDFVDIDRPNEIRRPRDEDVETGF